MQRLLASVSHGPQPRYAHLATDLGRPSADHLANQIDELLNPRQQAHDGAID